MTSDVGIVIIGRNEGRRLERSLERLHGRPEPVVYVDSGSTDGSVATARRLGAHVVELDPSRPFTAARGRNEGFRELVARRPEVAFVQFLDGDCLLDVGWLALGGKRLRADARLGILTGRRREVAPEASVYNRLTDMEWDGGPDGRRSCGGDALVRVAAFLAVDGYDEDLVAGEDPEFAHRIAAAGWTVLAVDAEMTRHDADLHRFSQWWRRCLRSGHAYAEGRALHRGAGGFFVRQTRSIWIWGVLVPVLALGGALLVSAWCLLLLLLFPLQVARLARRMSAAGRPAGDRWAYAFFCVLGKFPAAQGVLTFHLRRLLGRRSRLIEYKHGEGG
ncbi:MAG: glycosyltransferase [Planctomycetes bacterium]|nr:glycosyltransferase [Planctomycetota bacterium]